MFTRFLVIPCLLFSLNQIAFATDERAQLPTLLSNSYLTLNIGDINYPFSNFQMEPGFRATFVQVPHSAVRIEVGYHINKFLSAQIGYMKPLNQVEYHNVNGVQSVHTVWMHVGSLTAKTEIQVQKQFSLYDEGGLGIISRRGFNLNQVPAVQDQSYASFLLGGGFSYRINPNWSLGTGVTYVPEDQTRRQPHTIMISGGIRYETHPLAASAVAENSETPFIFPRNLIHFGYSTNSVGYGINNFLSKKPIDIFWGGQVEIAQGFSIHYQRNIFHTRKLFSLDNGISFGNWNSRINNDHFYTLSVFPLLRLTFLHTKPADLYFQYSVAGPTFISNTNIDTQNTGKHFTFQDFMGIGMFTGANRRFSVEFNLNHYSNGNIFTHNAGIKIPLSFSAGYTF